MSLSLSQTLEISDPFPYHVSASCIFLHFQNSNKQPKKKKKSPKSQSLKATWSIVVPPASPHNSKIANVDSDYKIEDELSYSLDHFFSTTHF
jgi:hypothetical protein